MKYKIVTLTILLGLLLTSCGDNNSIEKNQSDNKASEYTLPQKMEQVFGRVFYRDEDGNIWNWGQYATDGENVYDSASIPIKIDKIENITDFGFLNKYEYSPKSANTVILLDSIGNIYQLHVGENNNKTFELSLEKYNKVSNVKRIIAITMLPQYSKDTPCLVIEKNDGSYWVIQSKNYLLGNNVESLSLPKDFGKLKAMAEYGMILNEDGEVWQLEALDDGFDYEKIDISDVREIQRNIDIQLALKNDGTVWEWDIAMGNGGGIGSEVRDNKGIHISEKPAQIPNLSNIETISLGVGSFALDKNGNLYTWGGKTDTTAKYIKFMNKINENGGSYVVEIESDSYTDDPDMIVEEDDGSDRISSNDSNEEIFREEEVPMPEYQFPPEKVIFDKEDAIKYVYSGDLFTSIVTEEKMILCRGSNFSGQLGTGKSFEELELSIDFIPVKK